MLQKLNFKIMILIIASILLNLVMYDLSQAGDLGLKPLPRTSSADVYGSWMRDSRAKLNFLIGQPKEELLKYFGQPDDVAYNIPFKRKHYEERWWYKRMEGIPMLTEHSWVYGFYINSGKIEYIQVN